MSLKDTKNRCGVGINKLDNSLGGGLPSHQFYSLLGDIGSGRTTLGLQFLMAGQKKGQKGMLVTFSENIREIQRIALSHQFKIKKLEIIDFGLVVRELRLMTENGMESFGQEKISEILSYIMIKIQNIQPERLVIDIMSLFRLVKATDAVQKMLIWLRELLSSLNTTLILIDRIGAGSDDLLALAHGVLKISPKNDAEKSIFSLEIAKLRGMSLPHSRILLELRSGGFEAC